MPMEPLLSTRTRIAILIYSMVNAVLFGVGLVLVLNVPGLRAHLGWNIVMVVVLSLVLAAPLAWLIAPRLRARYARRLPEYDRAGVRAARVPDRPA
jgi:hypothetical protein